MTNQYNKVLYTGCTSNIEQRVYQHKNFLFDGFSKKYKTDKLVYLEEAPTTEEMVARERQLKNWARKKKDALINNINPEWKDLADNAL